MPSDVDATVSIVHRNLDDTVAAVTRVDKIATTDVDGGRLRVSIVFTVREAISWLLHEQRKDKRND